MDILTILVASGLICIGYAWGYHCGLKEGRHRERYEAAIVAAMRAIPFSKLERAEGTGQEQA